MKKRRVILTTVLVAAGLAANALLSVGAMASEAQTESVPETEPETESDNTYSFEEAGVTLVIPAALQDLKGGLVPDYGQELSEGSGLYLTGLDYVAVSEEKIEELNEKVFAGEELTDEEYNDLAERLIEVLLVYTVDEEKVTGDPATVLSDYGLPTEGMEEAGKAGSFSFYRILNPRADEIGEHFKLDEGFQEEYDTVIQAFEDPSCIRVYEPVEAPNPAAGNTISFETTDLEGNPVSSGDIFTGHKLTMVNLWGTFCGPCISEMQDLEELSHRLEEKGCVVIGVVTDVMGIDDSNGIATAQDILKEEGVTYPNLLPWESLDSDLPATAIPTSYFIDENGAVVGDAAVGARGADDYEKLIDELLEEMEG